LNFYFNRVDKFREEVNYEHPNFIRTLECLREVLPEYLDDLDPPKIETVFDETIQLVGDRYMFTDIYIESLFTTVKRTSSPGVDMVYTYQSNGALLDDNPEELKQRVNSRLNSHLQFANIIVGERSEMFVLDALMNCCQTFKNYKTAQHWVERDLCDPIRVFIKDEPTKTSKEDRVICSVSVVDSLLERAPILDHFMSLRHKWTNGPSSIGIDLSSVDSMQIFRNNLFKRLGNLSANSDLQGFEYCFNSYCFFVCFIMQFYLIFRKFPWEVKMKELTLQGKLLFLNALLDQLDKVIVCSDGKVIKTNRVWLASGRFKTSYYGTLFRSILPSLTANFYANNVENIYVPSTANGDDCVEKFAFNNIESFVSGYAKFGFKVTDYKIIRYGEDISFCSQIISDGTHYPESILKQTLHLLRHKVVDKELWDQFHYVMHRRKDWGELEEICLNILSASDLSGQTLQN